MFRSIKTRKCNMATALNAIRLIRSFFNTEELIQLVISNFYSILYYNYEVWHLKTLNQSVKNLLMRASAKALKPE